MLKFMFQKSNRHFMRFWWGQMISQFGDRINQMALIGLITLREPGSTLGLAKVLAFTIIPVFVIGPVAGVFVDRWDRAKVLFLCDIVRALLVLLIPWIFIRWESLIPLYIIVFIIFTFSRFHVPAKMSIVPDLIEEKNLLMANSMLTTTGMIAFAVGAAAGGFIVEIVGVKGGFFIDAATFLVSGLLILSIAKNRSFIVNRQELINTGREFVKLEKSFFQEFKEGLAYLFKQRDIRFVISTLFILFSAAGAVYVVIIIFVQQAFHSLTRDLGILAVALGAGLFLGAVAYGRWGKNFKWYTTIFACLVLAGLMLNIFALVVYFYTSIIVAAALAAVLGMVLGPVFIASNTIVHLVSDQEMRGKIFSSLEVVIHLAFLLAMMFSAWISEFIDRVWILTGIGVIFAVIGLIGLIRYKNGGKLALIGEDVA